MNLPRKYRLPLYLYYYEGYAVRGDRPAAPAQALHRPDSAGPGQEQLQHILQEEWSYE